VSVERALGAVRAPDETGAEARAWPVVRCAYVERAPNPAARRPGRRFAASVVLASLIAAVVLSPAGATVGRLITRALGVHHAAPALFSLPAPGRLLVSGPAGTWTVAANGSTRSLGSWRQASWSPHGLFVAVAGADRLLAVDPRGAARWGLARPDVADPTWYSPSGYRIAYRSAGELRVVAGDGTGDRLLVAGVARVAPAWRPGHPYELAYLTARGLLTVRDADTAGLVWSSVAPRSIHKLMWSADGSRLLAIGRSQVAVYDGRGRRIAAIVAVARDGSLSPDGRTVAIVRGGEASDVILARVGTPGLPRFKRVWSAAGLGSVAWSPDGRWLLISWPAANQWVFVRVAGRPRIVAFSRIRQQFGVRASAAAFPQLEGWCCTAVGTTG
jgi:WD40-like Beta Propeller Repeat